MAGLAPVFVSVVCARAPIQRNHARRGRLEAPIKYSGFQSARASARVMPLSVPRTHRHRRHSRVRAASPSQFPGNVSVIDVSVQHCDLVSAGRVSTSCVASRVLRARLLSRPRAPVPTSARPVPSRPDLRLAEPPKSKVNTRLTGRGRLLPCSQCALTHSDHISQAPAERAEARCPRACAQARAPLN